eukprot:6248055-Amphidinium_carterae.2
MAPAGDILLVQYEGAPLWHERLVMCSHRVTVGAYGIVTPDHDLYIEHYGGDDPNIQEVRLTRGLGDVPAGLEGGQFHRFDGVLVAEDVEHWCQTLHMLCGRPVPDVPVVVRRAGQRAEHSRGSEGSGCACG